MNTQQRYFKMLDSSPIAEKMSLYFDRERSHCEIKKLRGEFEVWSHGEQLLCSFFIVLWLGKESEGWSFDYVEALKILDYCGRKVVVEWGANPYYP